MEQNQKITVYEGKIFQVDLKSMYGSTPYLWCVSKLPEGIMLVSSEVIQSDSGMGPVIQRFQFGVQSVGASCELALEFVLACSFQIKDIRDKYVAALQLVPSDNSPFVPYNGMVYSQNGVDTPFFPDEMVDAYVHRTMKDFHYESDGTESPNYSPEFIDKFVHDVFPRFHYRSSRRQTALAYGMPYGQTMSSNAGLKYGYPSCT